VKPVKDGQCNYGSQPELQPILFTSLHLCGCMQIQQHHMIWPVSLLCYNKDRFYITQTCVFFVICNTFPTQPPILFILFKQFLYFVFCTRDEDGNSDKLRSISIVRSQTKATEFAR
jgi:hypothetical protein